MFISTIFLSLHYQNIALKTRGTARKKSKKKVTLKKKSLFLECAFAFKNGFFLSKKLPIEMSPENPETLTTTFHQVINKWQYRMNILIIFNDVPFPFNYNWYPGPSSS